MSLRNFYTVLGVPKSASADEIKRAYRKLARQLHPDMNPGDAQAEERFKEVSVAFEVLSDPERRSLYDEFGEDAIRLGFDKEKAKQYRQYRARGGGGGGGDPFADLFGGGAQGFGGFDLGDILGDLFGGGGRRRGQPRPAKGSDLETQLSIELLEGVMEQAEREAVEEAFGRFLTIASSLSRALPDERQCPCALAMEQYRRENHVGEDWHTWIGKP